MHRKRLIHTFGFTLSSHAVRGHFLLLVLSIFLLLGMLLRSPFPDRHLAAATPTRSAFSAMHSASGILLMHGHGKPCASCH